MMVISGVTMIRKLMATRVVIGSLLLVIATQSTTASAQTAAPANSTDPSGMYTFLKEGEFVQVSVEDGALSGFISRFGDTDSDKGEFIDQFFDKATLEGDHLYFKTKTVHAVCYELDGTVSVVPGKKPGEEGYRVIRGLSLIHI